MLHDQVFLQRLQQAKIDCIARMQSAADWLEQSDPVDRAALGQCGHRLAGTLSSFAFLDAAMLARRLEQACGNAAQDVTTDRQALSAALRSLRAR